MDSRVETNEMSLLDKISKLNIVQLISIAVMLTCAILLILEAFEVDLLSGVLSKGLLSFIFAIAVAGFAYGSTFVPDEDPPVTRSEFITLQRELEAAIHAEKEKNNINETSINKLKQEKEFLQREVDFISKASLVRSLFLTDPPMTGEDVVYIQELLNQQGNNLSLDGVYGNNTAEAIKQYQSKNGLKIDGITGKETRRKLIEDAVMAP